MGLDINIHSSEEEDNIHVQVDVPKTVYKTVKSIFASIEAGKQIIQEIRKQLGGKDNV